MVKIKFASCVAVLGSVALLASCGPSTPSSSSSSPTGSAGSDFVADTAIKVASRDATSGTREVFTEKALIPNARADENMVPHESVPSSDAMINAIAGDKYAIGYSSFDSVKGNNSVKMLSFGKEGALVAPTEATIESKSYSLQRYFNIVVNPADTGDNRGKVAQAFLDFTLSNDGLDVAQANGGIITAELRANARDYTAANFQADFDLFSQDLSAVTVAVGGSTSVAGISDAQIEKFKTYFTGTGRAPVINVNRSGSGSAVSGLKDGTLNIGYLSRELNANESTDVTTNNYVQAHFSVDAVAVIVHPSNPLTGISDVQLGRIYGKQSYLETLAAFTDKTNITNWSQLIG